MDVVVVVCVCAATLVLHYFLEQGTLFTLFQSTQLFKWGPSGLVSTGEAAHPAVTSIGTWGSICLYRLVVLGLLWNYRFCDLSP